MVASVIFDCRVGVGTVLAAGADMNVNKRGLPWSSKSIAPPRGWDAQSQLDALRDRPVKTARTKKALPARARRGPKR